MLSLFSVAKLMKGGVKYGSQRHLEERVNDSIHIKRAAQHFIEKALTKRYAKYLIDSACLWYLIFILDLPSPSTSRRSHGDRACQNTLPMDTVSAGESSLSRKDMTRMDRARSTPAGLDQVYEEVMSHLLYRTCHIYIESVSRSTSTS